MARKTVFAAPPIPPQPTLKRGSPLRRTPEDSPFASGQNQGIHLRERDESLALRGASGWAPPLQPDETQAYLDKGGQGPLKREPAQKTSPAFPAINLRGKR